MPYAHGYRTETLIASADLRKGQFKAIKRNAQGQAAQSGAGEVIFGVIQQVEGLGVAGKDVVTYYVDGDHPARLGGTVAIDDRLIADAQGRLVKAAPGSGVTVRTYYLALEAGAVDQTATVRREVADVTG